MSEFTPIMTQEEFDARIRDRLKQKEKSVMEKYEKYLSEDDVTKIKTDYDKQISDLTRTIEGYTKEKESWEKTLAEKDATIKAHESHSVKTRIANELGLPYDAIDFIKGDDEKSIRESAEVLKSFTKAKTQPLANPEPPASDAAAAAWSAMSNTLSKGV